MVIMKTEEYSTIIVESYKPESTSGLHGEVHIRPCEGQFPFTTDMHVACSKTLSNDYPPGTRFQIKAKLTSREGGAPFAYSHYLWKYTVL